MGMELAIGAAFMTFIVMLVIFLAAGSLLAVIAIKRREAAKAKAEGVHQSSS